MAETTAQARARWSQAHGQPWSESAAGQIAGQSPTSTTNEEESPGGAPNGAPGGSSSILGGVHAGIKKGSGGTVAGGLLGLLAFLTVRAYLAGGMAEVKAFYAAKFVNKVKSAPAPAPRAPAPTTGMKGSLLGPQAPATTTSPTLTAA